MDKVIVSCFSTHGVLRTKLTVQNLLKNAGGSNKPTVFLITDSQFKEEVFLEDIDSLLNASEVPNLFAPDEKVEVIEV